MGLSKVDFFQAYPNLETKQQVKGKFRSLSKEIYVLKKLISQEKKIDDKKRLYQIAVNIYNNRHKQPTFCNQIKSLFYNVICGRGFATTEFFFNQIRKEGKIYQFNSVKSSSTHGSPSGKKSVAKTLSKQSESSSSESDSSRSSSTDDLSSLSFESDSSKNSLTDHLSNSSKCESSKDGSKASTQITRTLSKQSKSGALSNSSKSESSKNSSKNSSRKESVSTTLAEQYGLLDLKEIERKGEEILEFFNKESLLDYDLEKICWFFQNFDKDKIRALIKGLFSNQPKPCVFMNCLIALYNLPETEQKSYTQILIHQLYSQNKLSPYLKLTSFANSDYQVKVAKCFVAHYITMAIIANNNTAGSNLLNNLWASDLSIMTTVMKENFEKFAFTASRFFLWAESNCRGVLDREISDIEFIEKKRILEIFQQKRKDNKELMNFLKVLYDLDFYLDGSYKSVLRLLTKEEFNDFVNTKFFKLDIIRTFNELTHLFSPLSEEQAKSLMNEVLRKEIVTYQKMFNIINALTLNKAIGYGTFIEFLDDKMLEELFTQITPNKVKEITSDVMSPSSNIDEQELLLATSLNHFLKAYIRYAYSNKDRAPFLFKVFKENSPIVFQSYMNKLKSENQAVINDYLARA